MKSFPTSSSLWRKPGGTKEKLLKLIRGHPACVLALRLDVTMRISDEDIMEALAKSADNLDIDFRERMVPEEMIQEILELRLQARKEAALMSEIRRHNVWIVMLRLPLCAGVILIFVSFISFLTTFEYVRAVCALHEFANATCSQANTCLFRVAVQLPGEQFSIFHPAWKMPAEEAYGTAVFAENGPFKCCNTPGVYSGRQGAAGPRDPSSIAVGAGTPCCEFLDVNRSLYCDNFGDSQRLPSPVPGCPASPWFCGVKTEIVDGETTVKELQVWVELPILEVFLASLACFGTSALVRIFPIVMAFLGRHWEGFNSRFHGVAKRAKRRLRHLAKRRGATGRSSQTSTSSDAPPPPSRPERTVRKVKPKVSQAESKASESRPEQLEVASLHSGSEEELPRPPLIVQLRTSQQGRSSLVPEVGHAEPATPASPASFTAPSSPKVTALGTTTAVTVTVKPAKVQPKEVTVKPQPVRLEEVLRPIITPATNLRRDNSRDREMQAPSSRSPHAARPRLRPGPRQPRQPRPRAHRDGRAVGAVAPQATVSPAKVMQMSQTQEQWMATSAQLRQLSHAQDPPPDFGTAPLHLGGKAPDKRRTADGRAAPVVRSTARSAAPSIQI